MAFTGVRNCGCTRPKNRGRSPCSASANRLREPESAWPMLLPVVESTAPSVRSAAPAPPMKSVAASASGVLEAARPGSVPSATTCTRVITIVTITMVMIRANGTARLGSRASPAGTGNDLVAAEGEDEQEAGGRELGERRRLLRHEQGRIDEEDPDRDKREERQQLPDRQHVQHQAALADASDIDGGNHHDDDRDETGAAPSARRAPGGRTPAPLPGR